MESLPGIYVLVVIMTVDPCVHGFEPRFHIPYACSITFDLGIPGKESVLIGAGAIMDRGIIAVSVDNLNNPVQPDAIAYFYEHIDKIHIHAGTIYADPRRVKPSPKNAQTVQAGVLYVPYKPSFNEKDPTKMFWRNPTNLSDPQIEYDAFGVALNVGFLWTRPSFSYSPFVLPIAVSDPHSNFKKLTKTFIEVQEKAPMSRDLCFTYSYNEATNKMRYHQVTYVPRSNCVDIYCMYQLSKCTLFPKHEHLACFKSSKYIDVCPEARGAALYCDSFERSVFGILTFAPLCGQRNTPGVYTTLPLVIEFFNKVFNVSYLPPKTSYKMEDMARAQRDLVR